MVRIWRTVVSATILVKNFKAKVNLRKRNASNACKWGKGIQIFELNRALRKLQIKDSIHQV